MWFLGFPISMVLGGIFYQTIGPKRIMQFAFLGHTFGIVLTIYSGGYIGLLISTLLIGIGNGCTEAACNPMIADAYSGKTMNTLLNRFHMWFPGGIAIGALISKVMTDFNISWESQIWVIMIPTLIYVYLFLGQQFPKPRIEEIHQISKNIKAMFSPLFVFMMACMAFTAISEFGPQQWTSLILKDSGANPMVVLALIASVMAVARYWGGELVHKFDQSVLVEEAKTA